MNHFFFIYSPSILLSCEPLTRPVPFDLAICVDYDIMWLWRAFVLLHWLFQLAIHCSGCLCSLAAESHSRAWTQLDVFPRPLLACALRPHTCWIDCSAWPVYDFVFFDRIMEWMLGVLLCIEIRFDFLHVVSFFHWLQVQQVARGLSGCLCCFQNDLMALYCTLSSFSRLDCNRVVRPKP